MSYEYMFLYFMGCGEVAQMSILGADTGKTNRRLPSHAAKRNAACKCRENI
jgi:hypothetical protein